MASDAIGKWEPLFDLNNVCIHASLLPTGKVLYWGRRSDPKSTDGASLNEHFTNSYLWDPATGASSATATQPKGIAGGNVNLFCAGYSFQPDGSLFIVGGHLFDGQGVNQACVYDPKAGTWSPKPLMNNGRWYPSALTLPDGSVLSISGSYGVTNAQGGTDIATNIVPQIWRNDNWTTVANPPGNFLLLYPRLHLDPSGRVFMAGPQEQSQFLDVNAAGGVGVWTTDGPKRLAGAREYAPSVMYDSGKVMYIGGGNNPSDQKPTKMTELIDLNTAKPQWTPTTDMLFARRQHNATVLPDGTVLVNGGTQGAGFNNLDAGMPVHKAELWDPVTQEWTEMAEESADRCYHSIALLLPDGQVLSAGGGEYSPNNDGRPNPAKDSLTNAQLFKPPYLFKGDRPTVSNAPTEVNYNQTFEVTVSADHSIAKVSWVRLGSVTHACNMNQSLSFLSFQQQGSTVKVQAPTNANLTPPGHYMLFLLNPQGVPSVADIIQIGPARASPSPMRAAHLPSRERAVEDMDLALPALNEQIINQRAQPAVVVGLTPVCPYGLGPCWGGAFDALRQIRDIDVVRPVPDQSDSVAFVYLRQDTLPDIEEWRKEFEKTANGAYKMRGIEMTLNGLIVKKQLDGDEQLILSRPSGQPELLLTPFQAASKIEWDMKKQAPQPMSDVEAGMYASLSETLSVYPTGLMAQVTGRLQKHGPNNFSLDIRSFKTVSDEASPRL